VDKEDGGTNGDIAPDVAVRDLEDQARVDERPEPLEDRLLEPLVEGVWNVSSSVVVGGVGMR
jgi:hypothetical protein